MENIDDLKSLVNEITDLTNGDYHYDIKGRSGLSKEYEKAEQEFLVHT